ncbi:MAG: phosphate regulon sensor histidine kinase PhoR [Nevskiales bacterium]
MNQRWRDELIRLGLWVALGTLLGYWASHPAAGIALGLAGGVARHLWQLKRLAEWLAGPEGVEPPDSIGIWGTIFEELYQREQRKRRYANELTNVINDYQASTAALPDGAVVLDPTSHISWCNEAAITLLGLRMPQDLGQTVANLLRNPRFTAYLAAGQYLDEIVIPSPVDGQLALSLRVVPYGNGQRLMIARDVTRLQQMERVRRDFVANASHELRTPLTVLRGYLEMIEEESSEGPLTAWRTQFGEMRQQATRMSKIIEDLLKLARLESHDQSVRHEAVDVARMLRTIVEEARAMSKGQHQFQLEAQAGLYLLGHTSELHSVFSNLIFNAVQYTPRGGEILVRWWGDAEGAYFSCRDTGIGIPAKHIPRLTERFYRVDAGRSRATGGTGLGLAIVKHALEHHDARLTIESAVGVGSTFSCHFPVSRLGQRAA